MTGLPKIKLKIKTLPTYDIRNIEGLFYVTSLPNESIDLVLTDPPYIISHNSGMDQLYNEVHDNQIKGVNFVKTESDWEQYKRGNHLPDDTYKTKYLQYGTIYGRKYCVKTNYGTWDQQFTMEHLRQFVEQFYQKLRKGGTLIIFFDIWKITLLRDLMMCVGFKQIRFLEWIKTNPQPRNSKINYLTNCREIALLGVKGRHPVFNSSYDKGIYYYPLQSKNRLHPTQKSLELFIELINKHSRYGDTVLDPFLGAGTTVIACQHCGRHFKGCEISKQYYDQIMKQLK
jgi:site-specific DNA-methyltransferase (adenine-specific)